MFPPTTDPPSCDARRRSQGRAGHVGRRAGARRSDEPWSYVVDGRPQPPRSPSTRVFELTGPAAGSDLVKTAADPEGRWVKGTLGQLRRRHHPVGHRPVRRGELQRLLRAPAGTPSEALRRHATTARDRLAQYDPRFDARNAGYVNEPNRFGWIVEIDPQDPTSTPASTPRWAASSTRAPTSSIAEDGHVVAYMGDDERFDYLYKFVSKDKYPPRRDRAQEHDAADRGRPVRRAVHRQLAGRRDHRHRRPADRRRVRRHRRVDRRWWRRRERRARHDRRGGARLHPPRRRRVGATKMDRPEDVEPSPTPARSTSRAPTTPTAASSARRVDEANPRNRNRDGHVVEITETGDHTATTFAWSILILCGDPARTTPPTSPASRGAGLADLLPRQRRVRLRRATSGSPPTARRHDRLQRRPVQGAARGPERGHVQQFLAVPREAETCGPVIHDQEGLVFVAVQHPGEDGVGRRADLVLPRLRRRPRRRALPRRGPRSCRSGGAEARSRRS